jgi:hypothetical protein
MKFFELHHSSKVTHVQRVMEKYVDTYSILYQANRPVQLLAPDQQDLTVTDDEYNVFASVASGPNDDSEQEIEGYMSGKFPLNGGTLLSWWKVCFICVITFILSPITKLLTTFCVSGQCWGISYPGPHGS